MSSVKYMAAKELADFIQQFVNDVPVVAQQQAYDKDANFPSIAILPGKHVFVPCISQEVNTEDQQKTLAKAGWMEGTTEIRIYSTLAPQRDLIEQRISEAFFAQDQLRTNCICVEIPAFNYGRTNWPNKAVAAYEINDLDWQDEMVFADKRYSFIELNSTYEVFVSYNQPTINEIDVRVENFDGQLIEQIEIE